MDTGLAALLIRGGPLMVLLGLGSVVFVCLTVERVIALSRRRVSPGFLRAEVREVVTVRGRGTARLVNLCQQSASPLAAVLRAVLAVGRGPLAELRPVADD